MANPYRKKITISGSTGGAQTDYPVRLNVVYDSDMQSDFGDLRFYDTSNNLLDHFVESYAASTSAIVWVKVPSIPVDPGTATVWMYFGDPDLSDASDGDATFSFFDDFYGRDYRAIADNADDPEILQTNYLAENIVYDSVTEKYWWVFMDANASPPNCKIAYSNSITGPYTVDSVVIPADGSYETNSPHIVKFGSYWYIYYGHGAGASAEIYCQRSTTINSGYSATGISNPVLTKGFSGNWDDRRVMEPYVFERGVDDYVMFFMGEDVANTYEKTGYATASSPEGPFTKYALNPVISGDSSWWDAGTDKAADPFVFKKNETYYIGITAAESGKSGWRIGFWETVDFVNFYAIDNTGEPVLDHGIPNNWDDGCILRGAVQEFDGTFYLSYTGGSGASSGYQMGLTVLTWDWHDEAWINDSKWTIIGSPTQSNGILTTVSESDYVKSSTTFGQNYAVRARTLLDTGSAHYSAIGFRNGWSGSDYLHFLANYPSLNDVRAYQYDTAAESSDDVDDPGVWAVFDVIRNGSTSGIYKIDDSQVAELTAQVTADNLPAEFIYYAQSDWLFVRKYVNPEPGVEFGGKESVLLVAIQPGSTWIRGVRIQPA